ncbi:MAG: hypothetical protein IH986_11855 [Planctomycetes bacterium]|nr:hypothetical protein [Planctomycetota bacterium]
MTKRLIVLLAFAVVAMLVAPPVYAQNWVRLSNGIAGDGELEENTDTYGAVTVWNWPDNFDWWNPVGLPDPRNNVSFASNMFVYNLATQDRVALGEEFEDIDNTYNQRGVAPATFTYAIVTALVAFDTDGDGIDDSSTSTFSVTGGNAGYDLQFDLAQNVAKPVGGTSCWTKTYTITNNSGAPADIQVAYHCDLDIAFDADFTDPAGVAELAGLLNPYMQEPDNFANFENTKISLSGTPGYDYVAGRSGFDPDGPGPDPAMAFGTDFQQWDNFGMPNSWKNYAAGIGHNTVGIDPSATPAGGAAPNDGFMTLQWSVSLAAGASTDIQVVLCYGSATPVGGACGADICGDTSCDGVFNGGDIDPFFVALGDPVLWAIQHPNCDIVCVADINGDGNVNGGDIDPFFAALGGIGPCDSGGG